MDTFLYADIRRRDLLAEGRDLTLGTNLARIRRCRAGTGPTAIRRLLDAVLRQSPRPVAC
jgi:hypothetical protein